MLSLILMFELFNYFIRNAIILLKITLQNFGFWISEMSNTFNKAHVYPSCF